MNSRRDFMSLTLVHFECFIKVAELGTTLKAAEEMNLSQPVISQKIAQLEKGAHLQLFERAKKRLTLTEDGKAFLERSKAMLEQWDQFLDEMVSTHPSHAVKPLRIGFAEGTEEAFIRAAVDSFGEQGSASQIEAIIENRALIFEKLLSGNLDIAVFADTENMGSNTAVRYRKVASLPLNCAVHRDSPIAQRETIQCRDLNGYICYCPSSLKGSREFKNYQNYFKERGVRVEWKFRDVDFSTLRRYYLHEKNCFSLTCNPVVSEPASKLYRLDGVSIPLILAWRKQNSAVIERHVEKFLPIMQKLISEKTGF